MPKEVKRPRKITRKRYKEAKMDCATIGGYFRDGPQGLSCYATKRDSKRRSCKDSGGVYKKVDGKWGCHGRSAKGNGSRSACHEAGKVYRKVDGKWGCHDRVRNATSNSLKGANQVAFKTKDGEIVRFRTHGGEDLAGDKARALERRSCRASGGRPYTRNGVVKCAKGAKKSRSIKAE